VNEEFCHYCGAELLEPGGLVLSPPDEDNRCERLHVCAECYPDVVRAGAVSRYRRERGMSEKIDLDAIEKRAKAAGNWDSLDTTPMMPTSKADPGYGGAAHRFIAHAPGVITDLAAWVREARGFLEAYVSDCEERDVRSGALSHARAILKRLEP